MEPYGGYGSRGARSVHSLSFKFRIFSVHSSCSRSARRGTQHGRVTLSSNKHVNRCTPGRERDKEREGERERGIDMERKREREREEQLEQPLRNSVSVPSLLGPP